MFAFFFCCAICSIILNMWKSTFPYQYCHKSPKTGFIPWIKEAWTNIGSWGSIYRKRWPSITFLYVVQICRSVFPLSRHLPDVWSSTAGIWAMVMLAGKFWVLNPLEYTGGAVLVYLIRMCPQRWAVEQISLVEFSPVVWRQVCLWIFLGSLNSVETNEIAVTLRTVIDRDQTQFYNFLWQFLSEHRGC